MTIRETQLLYSAILFSFRVSRPAIFKRPVFSYWGPVENLHIAGKKTSQGKGPGSAGFMLKQAIRAIRQEELKTEIS